TRRTSTGFRETTCTAPTSPDSRRWPTRCWTRAWSDSRAARGRSVCSGRAGYTRLRRPGTQPDRGCVMDASRAGASARDPGTDRRRLRRDVGRTALLFASLGSIIGSGWLFASLFAAQLAGPAALISWLIAGLAVLLTVMIYSHH